MFRHALVGAALVTALLLSVTREPDEGRPRRARGVLVPDWQTYAEIAAQIWVPEPSKGPTAILPDLFHLPQNAAEYAEEQRQARHWLRMGVDAFERGEFDLAEAHAMKVLDLDPNHRWAKKLRRLAMEERAIAERLELRDAFNDEWRAIMERLEYDAIGGHTVLEYPADWDEIAR